jgi:hypothetical protein
MTMILFLRSIAIEERITDEGITKGGEMQRIKNKGKYLGQEGSCRDRK